MAVTIAPVLVSPQDSEMLTIIHALEEWRHFLEEAQHLVEI